MIRFYNTLTGKKEELKPLHKEWVGLYTCGPTVYNFAHIGNLRTYIFEDVLQKTLEYNGYEVRRAMNITDVGHLTGDSDVGDDKLDKEARAQKKSVEEIAEFYTKAFFKDLEKLNIKKPDIIAPATKFIREQVSVIEILLERGFAYQTKNAIYFDVSKCKDYGKLSGQSLQEKMTGAREEVVVDEEKRNPADFVLWFKLTGKFMKHLLHWPSPWGDGFPGWHIECSTISRYFLQQPFDIHAGGVDLIGTHNTNEIAQSESAFGVPLANLWMHGEHLLIGEGKMAKSEGNFITLSELEKKGYDPIIFRYLVLGAHYRTKLNFTWESLDAARNGLENLYRMISECSGEAAEEKGRVSQGRPPTDRADYEDSFLNATNDDLNTPKALAVLQKALSSPLSSTDKIALVQEFDRALGLEFNVPIKYSAKKDKKIALKMREYETLRDNKQFVQSDALRKEVESLGYSIRDTPTGPRVTKIFFPHGNKKIATEDPAAES